MAFHENPVISEMEQIEENAIYFSSMGVPPTWLLFVYLFWYDNIL